ncbi:uncharacterized protein LOC131215562 [Anopheles bellator]|uniref:uncharacterized protein LOC131215562 n=1 Tax=Anopheles bellator TaxID=139047 RepID=UPI0026493352|nr:uncharacterized protein LOC131215562 [Anopheles bellator]
MNGGISCVALLISLTQLSSADNPRLPAFYELDDWDNCTGGVGDPVVYCMVRVLVPSATEEADDRKHFRRTLLDRGICLTTARELVQNYTQVGVPATFPASWKRTDRYILSRRFYPPTYHPHPEEERVASVLVRRRLVTNTQAQVSPPYTEIEYCLRNFSRGHYNVALKVTLSIGVSLACILCVKRLLWPSRVLLEPHVARGECQRHFLLFDLYKCYGLVGVVLAHCCLFGPFLMPMKDMAELERVLTQPNIKLARMVFPFLMLVFFIMSSMLLTVKLLDNARRSAPQRPTLAAIIGHRLIRLQPLNVLTVGFCALAYEHFVAGPLGPRQLIVEQTMCRTHWLTNVLFLSNYNTREPCLPHSWYVSTDFQLFVTTATVLCALHRWPHWKSAILTGLGLCAFLGPFLSVLGNDFDPIGPTSLHEMRFFLLDSPFMARLYTPFYNNLCWSVGGMAAGFAYDRCRTALEAPSVTDGQRRRMVRRVNLSLLLALTLLATFIHLTIEASESSADASRWRLAAYYALYKLSAAAFFSVLFVRVLLTETDFYGSAVVRCGAKLYYAVYLIHFPIFRIVFSNETAVRDVSAELLVWMGLKVFVISYLCAVLLHYAVEQPLVGFLRRIFFRS